jgi:hypothetical protein
VRRILITLAVAVLGLGFAAPAPATSTATPMATGTGTATGSGTAHLKAHQKAQLLRYAEATWASFEAMVDTPSGLPTDQLHADGSTDVQTSTTNIGAYLWSAVAARRLGIISRHELVDRVRTTVGTLERMETYRETGQFYNWYDHRDGSKLTAWPPNPDDQNFHPILSSVDNAWLATGLRIVANTMFEIAAPDVAASQLARRARAIYDAMDFGFYYVPDQNRILFHFRPDDPSASPCCYDTVVSESRIADYIGIAKGELPRKEYYGRWRSFPATCDYSWQETRPAGFTRLYQGVSVYDGSYPYGSTRLTPSWGGSMFEALMPALFVPEEKWGAGSWRKNHPYTVDAQIDHGLNVAQYGVWGFSPSNTPEGGYGAYGVDAIGMDPNGMPSNEDVTLVDHGFPGCPGRDPQPDPPPGAYTNGVVTPHATFLALRYRPGAAMTNLSRLEAMPGVYGQYGFADSVNVGTGRPSQGYLSLDQGMIMAAIANALGNDVMRRAFVTPALTRTLRAVLGVEEFNIRPRGCTIIGTAGPDRLVGTHRPDVICGLGGDDRIVGRGGDDVLYGDAGADRIIGGRGDDTLYGDEGMDRLDGGGGSDVLNGGPGRDWLSGGRGADHAEGGGGGDRCVTDRADDAPGDC